MQTKKETKTEMHPHFPSGQWEGFYLQFGVQYKMESTLTFCEGIVTGQGIDGIGTYAWKGKYDAREGTCYMTKTYTGAHQVHYTGQVDENGFWGQWKILWTGEGFHIWPKKAKSHHGVQSIEQEAVEITQSDEISIEQLVL